MKRLYLSALALSLTVLSLVAKSYSLSSPDGNVKVTVDAGERLTWSIDFNGETVVAPSAIGLDIESTKIQPGINPRVTNASRRSVDKVLKVDVPTKFSEIRDHCNELTLKMRGDYSVQFRAYDNGAAYRFVLNYKGDVIVADETVDLALPTGTSAYWPMAFEPGFKTSQEVKFDNRALTSLTPDLKGQLPVYMVTPAGNRVVVTEADVDDYTQLFLTSDASETLKGEFPRVIKEVKLRGDRTEDIIEEYPYIAKINGTRSLPWRIVMLSPDDKSLLVNTLPWQLSSPSCVEDASWIKPGKIAWDWWSMLNVYGVDFEAGVNTDTYKYIIDFAADKGIEYILLDEGWSQGTWDLKHYKPEVNVEELVEYGRQKGVGLVLWGLWNPLDPDIEGILDVYRDWGVKGIKIDFMNRSDQYMVNFYDRVGKAAAERNLMVDFHGAYKPCGVQRKWPNVMTFEGVLGLEHCKDSRDIDPRHNLVLPFTRMMAGPMDYTPGAAKNATAEDFSINFHHPMSLGTRAQQAALFVVYESPLQMMADSPSNYNLAPGYADFLARIPTVWDETLPIDAAIGEHLVMARRNGDKWYIAALTDWTPRDMSVTLDFLPEGKYEMTTFADGRNAHKEATDYKISATEVSSGDTINFHLAPGGGWTAIIEPK